MVITCKIKLSPRERLLYEGKQGKTKANMMKRLTLIADNSDAVEFAEPESKCFLSLHSGYVLSAYDELLNALAAEDTTLPDLTVEPTIKYQKVKLPLFSGGTYKKMFVPSDGVDAALSALGVMNRCDKKTFASELTKEECMDKVFAWCDPTLAVYANSVLGARSHKGSDMTALCQTVLGLVPVSGAVNVDNRKPTVAVKLSFSKLPNGVLLGAAVAKLTKGNVPVILGLDKLIAESDDEKRFDYLFDFSSGYAEECDVPLFHAPSVTAEIERYDISALGDCATEVTDDDLNEYLNELNVGKGGMKKNFPSVATFAPICSLPSAKKTNVLTDDLSIARSGGAVFKVKGE